MLDIVTTAISTTRLEQLIKAEHDANHLKALLAFKYENYGSFSRDELEVLYAMYIGFGKKEEE